MAYPDSGAQLALVLVKVMVMDSGTPLTWVDEPTELRMSERTMPLSASTL